MKVLKILKRLDQQMQMLSRVTGFERHVVMRNIEICFMELDKC